MRRCLILILLVALAFLVSLAGHADAAVVSTVRGDTLLVNGDGGADEVVLRLEPTAPARLLVEAGNSTRSFDRNTFSRITLATGGGADDIRIDESDGVFTDAEAVTVDAGPGDDVVTGGRGAEVITTGDGTDLVLGGGGADRILLGAGDDTAIQGSEDDADVFEGQSGTDTLRILATGESEELTVQAFGARALISRDLGTAGADTVGIEQAEINAGGGPDLVDIGDLTGTELVRVDADLGVLDDASDQVTIAGSADRDAVRVSAAAEAVRISGLHSEVQLHHAGPAQDRLTVSGHEGDDEIRAVGAIGTRLELTLDGGDGLDSLTGGFATERLRGGPGADTLRGQQGVDTIDGEAGPDLVVWNPSIDGNDRVDGGTDEDALRVLGAGTDEFQVVPDGSGVQVRSANVQVAAEATEMIDVAAGLGQDTVTVRDLSGTAVDFVRVDIGAGDLRSDTVSVEGTAGPDKIRAVAGFDSHELIGLATRLFVVGAEPGDRLRIDGRDGDDTIDASAMAKDKFQPFLTGGAGKDVLVGSPGQDVVTGGPGVDVGLLRDGLDTFTWQVGDGNDIVEGGAGTDFLQMAGSDAAERFAVESLGSRTRLLRESDVVDLGDVERLDVLAGRGADTMEVNDLSGTDTDVVTWELAPTRGTTATDQAADSVTVDGTFGIDAISVTAAGQEVRVSGLAASVVLLRADPGLDRLTVDTKAGADLTSVSPIVHQRLVLSVI